MTGLYIGAQTLPLHHTSIKKELPSLQERRKDDPAPRVLGPSFLPVKELPQARVLLYGPLGHLEETSEHEKDAGNRLGRQIEKQPTVDFARVVCAPAR